MPFKATLVFPLILLFSETAVAQRNAPLFLDARTGEDPAVIDVTEITGQYAKAAIEEYEKGLGEGRKGNRLSAQEHLQAAIRIQPDFFNAHNSLAILFHRTSQYRDAEREYREAARLNPRSAAPHVNIATMFIEEAFALSATDTKASRTRLNDALASLNKALEIQPGAPLAFYGTAVVYYVTGFYEESESYFKKSLASGDPRVILAHLALADIYIRLQEWDNVIVQIDQYLEDVPLAPNRVKIRSVRSAALEKLEAPGQ